MRVFGRLYVNEVSLNFQRDNLIQTGNIEPKTKIQPKKSEEIIDSPSGSGPPEVPLTAQAD